MNRSLPCPCMARRTRRAMRRMSELQRSIFLAMRFEGATYPELAQRHGISIGHVEKEFAETLKILVREFREPEPLWRRLWPW